MSEGALRREMGLGGAVVTGLGAILGTGAYVSIGIAAGQWGDAVLFAIPLAGVVALCSGLSSAHLAGRFPVAGGTYEYGYQTLGPYWGFAAGWLFILAKTASAASAALGVALYLGLPAARWLAIVIAMATTALVAGGLRRTTMVNLILVTATVAGLLAFISNGLDMVFADIALPIAPDPTAVLPAIAFLFVAFTGYGRVATLGEEVVAPKRSIPRAVVITLGIAVALYLAVALAARDIFGSHWGRALAGGSTLADLIPPPWSTLVAVGAITAMAGVLLNLVLGLSRVWLAMGRRGDMPRGLARLDQRSQPTSAVWLSGALVAVLCLVGNIATTWSFSAFSVLLYYGITNLSALALDRRQGTAWAGLLSCLFLSMFVGLSTLLIGTALLIVGVVWKRQRPA